MSDALDKYDPALAPPPRGLANPGVICHFNALTQAILSCTSIARAAGTHSARLRATRTGRGLLSLLRGEEGGHLSFFGGLLADLRERRPRVCYGGGQESASEGLFHILGMLSTDGNSVDGPFTRLFRVAYRIHVRCGSCGVVVHHGDDLNFTIDYFYLEDLPRLPATPEEFSGALISHSSPIESFRCERCHVSGPARAHYALVKVSEVIVIVRNLYDDQRPRTSDYFPQEFTLPSVAPSSPLVYRQVAKVEQTGSTRSGHYTADGVRAGGEVWHFNDDSVSRGELAASPNTYMIFYHLVQKKHGTP
jgi:hypothetical protein